MKLLLLCLFCIIVNPVTAQVRDTTAKTLPDEILKLVNVVDEYRYAPVNMDSLIVVFADSINNYSTGRIPKFLENPCLDQNGPFDRYIHNPPSYRWKILEKVTNKEALVKILNNQDKSLKKRCRYKPSKKYPYINIPFMGKSFHQLIQERYKQL